MPPPQLPARTNLAPADLVSGARDDGAAAAMHFAALQGMLQHTVPSGGMAPAQGNAPGVSPETQPAPVTSGEAMDQAAQRLIGSLTASISQAASPFGDAGAGSAQAGRPRAIDLQSHASTNTEVQRLTTMQATLQSMHARLISEQQAASRRLQELLAEEKVCTD